MGGGGGATLAANATPQAQWVLCCRCGHSVEWTRLAGIGFGHGSCERGGVSQAASSEGEPGVRHLRWARQNARRRCTVRNIDSRRTGGMRRVEAEVEQPLFQ